MKVPTNPHKHKTVHTSRSSRFSLWAGVSCDAMRRSTSKKRGGRKASILKADSEAELISDLNMAGFTFATAPGGRAPGAAPAPAAARVSKPDKRRSSVMALASNALSFIGAPAMAKAKVPKNFRWAPDTVFETTKTQKILSPRSDEKGSSFDDDDDDSEELSL